jgi:putative transposase
MHKAHKIQLSPTKAQEIFFKKSCGVARFSFNWALDKWKVKHEIVNKIENYSQFNTL